MFTSKNTKIDSLWKNARFSCRNKQEATAKGYYTDFESKLPKCKTKVSARMKDFHGSVWPILFTQGKEVSAAPREAVCRACPKDAEHEKTKKTRSPGAPLPLQTFKSCASSERRPSCWELRLENGDLGLIFGSAFDSSQTHTAAGRVLRFISSDCSFLRQGPSLHLGVAQEAPVSLGFFRQN